MGSVTVKIMTPLEELLTRRIAVPRCKNCGSVSDPIILNDMYGKPPTNPYRAVVQCKLCEGIWFLSEWMRNETYWK